MMIIKLLLIVLDYLYEHSHPPIGARGEETSRDNKVANLQKNLISLIQKETLHVFNLMLLFEVVIIF